MFTIWIRETGPPALTKDFLEVPMALETHQVMACVAPAMLDKLLRGKQDEARLSHFVRVARRSDSGLKAEDLNICI